MKSSDYSDIENGDETEHLTHKAIYQDTGCQQKACWWCLLLCPIGVAVGICILLTVFILDQLNKGDTIDDKVIVISRPWLNGTDIVNCSPDKPCEMTCEEYKRKSGNEVSECEFNYLYTIISGLILLLCGSTLVCSLLKLCIGYICHPNEKKTEGKKTTPKKIIIGRA